MADLTEHQAQVAVGHCKHLTNLKINLHQFTVERISGCNITTDGKILLTDYSDKKCLIGIDTEGKHLFTISTAPYDAFDVTCIDDITVAVTSGDTVISIVDISSRTVKKRIHVGYNCWGVTHKDGVLLVCDRYGILSINLTNEKKNTIVQSADLPWFSYITTYNYTNYESQTVTCCDMEGNALWIFKDDAVLGRPFGITTDDEGQVYVCDKVKDQVVVLSNDGRQNQTIIIEDDGLKCPCAIHFDRKRNNLLTANLRRRVFLSNVSSLYTEQ